MKSRKLTLLIGIVVFVIFVWFIKITDRELIKNGILLNAETTKWIGTAKMGLNLQYKFYYNGKEIISSNSFEPMRGNRDFENRYFPVMYDSALGSSQLLIRPVDFKRFNIPYPDSLNWVLKYLK